MRFRRKIAQGVFQQNRPEAVIEYLRNQGLLSIDNQSNQETIAVKLNGEVFGATSLDIAEPTAENDSCFDLYLQDWGYTTLTEKAASRFRL